MAPRLGRRLTNCVSLPTMKLTIRARATPDRTLVLPLLPASTMVPVALIAAGKCAPGRASRPRPQLLGAVPAGAQSQ